MSENKTQIYDIVAITACPVGIAHTYMAAEKLEKVAKEMGYTIKVQTNGSIGNKNEITPEEAKLAKKVILAVDIDVEDNIFHGKEVIKASIQEAVHKTESLIKRAMENTTKYKVENASSNKHKENDNKSAMGAYKHLLTGVSFMIPFVVIGGIFIAFAIALSGVNAEDGVNISNSILKKMESLGALSFSLMVPILAGYIGFSIAGKPALAPAMVGGLLARDMQTGFLGGIFIGFVAGYAVKYVLKIKVKQEIEAIMPIIVIPILGAIAVAVVMYSVGGYIGALMDFLTNALKNMQGASIILAAILGAMIAVDMGGPINKVAFLFGASMIAAGVPTIMGPIAVAICTPPIGMWLATVLSPKKYMIDEKQAGKASVLMGTIGITEGAIPFAAADPIRVIPSIIVGSATGAMVASFFKVANYAPHGGLIVLPVITNKMAFILAVVIGSVITALMVNTLKKNKV